MFLFHLPLRRLSLTLSAKTINVSSPDDPSEQSEEFLELANGCLCCSIKDTGIAAIEKLMKRKGAFDHILLETTGLADPGMSVHCVSPPELARASWLHPTGPIASMFWLNEDYSMGLGRDIHLDGVVCVVDAVFGRQVRTFCPQPLYTHPSTSPAVANG